jgi:hypothetical protein
MPLIKSKTAQERIDETAKKIVDEMAQEILDETVRCGVVFDLDPHSGIVTVGAAVEPSPLFRTWLKENRELIADLVREEWPFRTLH